MAMAMASTFADYFETGDLGTYSSSRTLPSPAANSSSSSLRSPDPATLLDMDNPWSTPTASTAPTSILQTTTASPVTVDASISLETKPAAIDISLTSVTPEMPLLDFESLHMGSDIAVANSTVAIPASLIDDDAPAWAESPGLVEMPSTLPTPAIITNRSLSPDEAARRTNSLSDITSGKPRKAKSSFLLQPARTSSLPTPPSSLSGSESSSALSQYSLELASAGFTFYGAPIQTRSNGDSWKFRKTSTVSIAPSIDDAIDKEPLISRIMELQRELKDIMTKMEQTQVLHKGLYDQNEVLLTYINNLHANAKMKAGIFGLPPP
ncbi:hypothetical protein BJ742DRAFT_851688 [Cladochytrium replicatum]|nr:hypothetical protein BJ742DRAFT_851688 [Cladochytrium replicatum]